MTDGPLFSYRAQCRAGSLKSDPMQGLVAEKLQSLHLAVSDHRPASGSAGWRERLGLARRQRETAPQGLYLFGPVGRGKSMLITMVSEMHATAAAMMSTPATMRTAMASTMSAMIAR